MKKMRVVMMLGFVLMLAACVQPVSNVEELELVGGGWEPKTQYALNESVDLDGTQIRVTFEDETTQTVSIDSDELNLQGNGINNDLTLNTSTSGNKEVVISYGGVTLTVSFLVYDVLVETLVELRGQLADDKVIVVADGTYSAAASDSVALSIENLDNLIIVGQNPQGAVIELNNESKYETISITDSTNITIADLTVKRNNGDDYSQALAIRESSNVTITNNLLTSDDVRGQSYVLNTALTIHQNTSNIIISDNVLSNFGRGVWIGDMSGSPSYFYTGNQPLNNIRFERNLFEDYDITGFESIGEIYGLFIANNTFDSEILIPVPEYENAKTHIIAFSVYFGDTYLQIMDLDLVLADNTFVQTVESNERFNVEDSGLEFYVGVINGTA
jgi:hypothetical protein